MISPNWWKVDYLVHYEDETQGIEEILFTRALDWSSVELRTEDFARSHHHGVPIFEIDFLRVRQLPLPNSRISQHPPNVTGEAGIVLVGKDAISDVAAARFSGVPPERSWAELLAAFQLDSVVDWNGTDWFDVLAELRLVELCEVDEPDEAPAWIWVFEHNPIGVHATRRIADWVERGSEIHYGAVCPYC